MGKLLLIALGVAVGTAVAVVLSAREQLDSPSVPSEPARMPFEPPSSSPAAVPAAE
jgi:hypothetical protein